MMAEKRVRRISLMFVIMAGACWGIIGIFSKSLSEIGFSPIQIVFLRFGFSAVLLWLYILIFDRDKMKIRFKDIWMFIGTGVLSLTLFSTLYFTTIQYTTLSLAAVLLYTAPCFVLMMSAIIFREKISKAKVTALLLAFFGCVCTSGLLETALRGNALNSVSLTGILTGVGAGFGYALYSIFGTLALKKYDTITVTAYTFLITTVTLLPFCFGKEFFVLFQCKGTLPSVVGITLVSTLLPYLLYTQGLKFIQPGKASVLAFSEPLIATLTGLLVFREKLTIGGAAGIILIFVSIVILNTKDHPKKDAENINKPINDTLEKT